MSSPIYRVTGRLGKEELPEHISKVTKFHASLMIKVSNPSHGIEIVGPRMEGNWTFGIAWCLGYVVWSALPSFRCLYCCGLLFRLTHIIYSHVPGHVPQPMLAMGYSLYAFHLPRTFHAFHLPCILHAHSMHIHEFTMCIPCIFHALPMHIP